MALLNAVECSIHLHGPSRLPTVIKKKKLLLSMTTATMTAVKESGFFHIFCITPQVVW